jgi:Tfp pilus assembly protein PilO
MLDSTSLTSHYTHFPLNYTLTYYTPLTFNSTQLHSTLLYSLLYNIFPKAVKMAAFESAQERELENQQLKETLRSQSVQINAAQEQYGALEEHALALERRLAVPSSSLIPSLITGIMCVKAS